MAVKIEVVTPITTVSEVSGNSTAIIVTRPIASPISTNGSQAVLQVIGQHLVTGIVAQQTPPAIPYEGMIWLSW